MGDASTKIMKILLSSKHTPELRKKYSFWRVNGLKPLCSLRMALKYKFTF